MKAIKTTAKFSSPTIRLTADCCLVSGKTSTTQFRNTMCLPEKVIPKTNIRNKAVFRSLVEHRNTKDKTYTNRVYRIIVLLPQISDALGTAQIDAITPKKKQEPSIPNSLLDLQSRSSFSTQLLIYSSSVFIGRHYDIDIFEAQISYQVQLFQEIASGNLSFILRADVCQHSSLGGTFSKKAIPPSSGQVAKLDIMYIMNIIIQKGAPKLKVWMQFLLDLY